MVQSDPFVASFYLGERCLPPSADNSGLSDPQLVLRLKHGDDEALAALFGRYGRIVYAVALRVLGESAAAEDVTQEIFMQLWRKPQLFDSQRGSLSAWLAVVTRHRSIDQIRKRRPQCDIEDVQLFSDIKLDEQVFRSLAMEKVRAALGRLPQEQRSALEMAFFDGLTHVEIAEKTSQPLGTIKTRIRSALLAVRSAMNDKE